MQTTTFTRHALPRLTALAFALSVALSASAVLAQGTSTAAPAAAASATPAVPAAPSSPAKKELVARILKLQTPSVEILARNLAEQPAAVILERAGQAIGQSVPADKQAAMAKDIRAEAKKYVEEAVPLVQARALKLAPTTIGPILEDKFTEDELKQIIMVLESAAYTKFQQAGGDMQNALLDKLVADTRSTIEPKVRALEATVGKRLGIEPAVPASAPAAAKPAKQPAKAASK